MLRTIVVVAALCFSAANTARSETWIGIGSSTGTSLAVDRDSFAPVAGSPHAVGFWIHAIYPMSIDCSPPRGCYAASQRIYVSVLCPARAIAVLQRISMDLNGNVVAQTDSGAVPLRYLRPYQSGVEGDAVRAFCGAYDHDDRWLR
jgi:hypothetical protein